MMRDPRRRSPESSSRRRRDGRRDSRQQHLASMPPEAMAPQDHFQPPRAAHRHRAPSSSRSASSSASSLLDISRHYPQPATGRWGGVLATFFRAPSERSRRTPRKATRKRRILRLGNSSSSSVNSDLAYGTGYIARPKGQGHRGYSPRRATAEAAAPGQSQRYHPRQHRDTAHPADAPSRPGLRKDKTDQEILDIGRRLSDFARKQNDHDLRATGRSRPTGLVAAAAAAAAAAATVSGSRRHGTSSRGIGASRPHGATSGDDSDWESASDQESSDGADSVLAYGSVVSQALRPPRPAASVAAGSTVGSSVSGPSMHGRQGSVVDPRLFGPVNSLRGLVTPRPFDDDESSLPAAQYRNFNRLRRVETEPIHENAPMRQVHAIPTGDPTRFDAETAPPIALRRSQTGPAPVPLQQPVPKAPVPSKVYNAEKLEDASRRDWRQTRHRSEEKALGEAAVAGVAAAAVGAVLVSDRRDRRDHRKDEKKREDRKKEERDSRGRREDERHRSDRGLDKSDKSEKGYKHRDRESDRDKERKSKRDSHSSSNHVDDKNHQKTRHHEDGHSSRKRRETASDHVSEPGAPRSRRGEMEIEAKPDRYSDIPRPRNRDDGNQDEHKDRRDPLGADDAASQRSGDPDRRRLDRAPIDPFRYQVENDALVTPQAASEQPLTPTVVTVDREPDFDGWSPKSRLSRKDSFDIDRLIESKEQGDGGKPRSRRSHDPEEQEAREVYDEARHATAPIAAAAIASAIAIERAQSRERRRRENSNGTSREDKSRPENEVQEQANRYYREVELARKIAGDQVRSHSHESERSVVGRWDNKDDTVDEPTIVTPPDVEDRAWGKGEGPYAAPDADVRIDNKIFPLEIDRFRPTGSEWGVSPFKSWDPSCERERPVLNLVYPTPGSSRYATPSPDSAPRRQEREEQVHPSAQPEPVSDVVSEPKGEPTQPSTSKSVSWGENSTKRFEVESPEPRSDAEHGRDVAGSGERSRPLLDRASQWGIIAAAMAGSSAEPDNEPEARDWGKESDPKPRNVAAAGPEQNLADEPTAAPPVPGPKPVSPEPGQMQMPGGFADDLEFAATLAAGLKDTGFDPNIVIDDPLYHRRDSPPGVSEPNGDGWNRRAASDITTDLDSHGSVAGGRSLSEPGFVIGEVETPRDEPSRASMAGEWVEEPTSLTKKERKRLEKLKRQSSEASEPATAEASGTSVFQDVADVGSRRGSTKEHRRHDSSTSRHGDEQYTGAEAESQGSKADAEVWEGSSRDKQKKNRRSRDLEDDAQSKVSVPTDAFDDLQSLRKEPADDDDWDASKKSKKKSKRNSEGYDSPVRSSAPSEVSVASSSRRSSESKRSSRSKRNGGNYDYFVNSGDDPPGRSKRSAFEDHEVSSVASESRHDKHKRDRREGKRSSRSYDDDDDAKSVASAPGPSHKSKDSGKKPGGLFSSIFKPSSSRDEPKRESFLDNAGTSGTGVGLASIAAVATAGHVCAHATGSSSEPEHDPLESSEEARDVEIFDPEVAQRAIKPAIDPQYGDLLPLPPSEPGSPRQSPEELPSLPDSRPGSPPDEQSWKRDNATHRRRRSIQEPHVKSPSRTAIPISLRLGQRGTPTQPSSNTFKSPPSASPTNTAAKRKARRISWDSSRAMMPLYLLEHSRHRSADSVPRQSNLPVLPASEPPSRGSPASEPKAVDDTTNIFDSGISAQDLADAGLRIDTSLVPAAVDHEIEGSQETTPRAGVRPELPSWPASGTSDGVQDKYVEPDPIESTSKDRSSFLLHSTPSSIESNRTPDRDGIARGSYGSSPTRQLHTTKGSADILEDLTSADEHFSDALEGGSEDVFEEALASPAPPVVSEQRLAEQQDEETVSETTVTTETEGAEPYERKLTAKEKRKAKKSRKYKSLDLASVAAAAATTLGVTAAAVTGANAAGSSSNQDSAASQASLDIAEQPTKGKGRKRNKKETPPVCDDLGETPAESGRDKSLAAPQPEISEAAGDHGASLIAERETPMPTPDPGAPGALAAASSDKDAEAFPAPEDGDEAKPLDKTPAAERTLDPAVDITPIVVSDPKFPTAGDILQGSSPDVEEQEAAREAVELREAPAPESDFQGHDGHRMAGESGDADQLVLETPEQLPAAAIKDEPELVPPVNDAPASDAVSDSLWSSTASSKKGKKTKKRRKAAAMQIEESQTVEDQPVLSSEIASVDQSRDMLDPVNETPEAAKEGVMVEEPEAVGPASPFSDTADQDATGATPAAIDKEAAEAQEIMDLTLRDAIQEPRRESSDQAESITEPSVIQQPREVDQSEPAVVAAAPAVAEDEPVASASAVESSTVDTEDTLATRANSRKEKKKRRKAKRKATQSEPDLSGALQEAEKDDADLPIDLAPKDPAASDFQPFAEPESVTAVKTEEAPHFPASPVVEVLDATAEGVLEEKMHSPLLSAPAIGPAVSAPTAGSDHEQPSQKDLVDEAEKEVIASFDSPQTVEGEDAPADAGQQDVPLEASQQQDSELVISEPLISQGEAPAEPTQDSEPIISEPLFSQDEHRLESTQAPTQREYTQAPESISEPAQDLTRLESTQAPESISEPALDLTRLESTQALEPISEPALDLTRLESTQALGPISEPVLDLTRLESTQAPGSILEPLFSKDETPGEPTQDPIPLDFAQADHPTPDVSPIVDATRTASASVAPHNVKKNEGESQGSMWDAGTDQKQASDSILSSGEAVVDEVTEDAAADTIERSSEAQHDVSALVAQEAPAEGGWEGPATGKKSNLTKDSKSSSATDPEPVAEPAPQSMDPLVTAEGSASIEGPSMSAQTDPSADVSAVVDERPQATGKKVKKKKRRSQIPVTSNDDSSTPAPLVDGPEVSKGARGVAGRQAEFTGSGKGKKNRKKQHRFSLDSASGAKPQQLADEPVVSPEGQPALEPETLPELESGLTGDEASVFPDDDRSRPIYGTDQGRDTPKLDTQSGSGPDFFGIGSSLEAKFPPYSVADNTLVDDSESPVPVQMSKKDRRKKKQAALSEVTQPGSEEASTKLDTSLDVVPEQASLELEATQATCVNRAIADSQIGEVAAVGTSSVVVRPGASDEAITEQPVGTSEQQAEANTDDEGSGFSLKQPKKDKKKKAKNNERTKPQEPETASLPGPEREQVYTHLEQKPEPLPEGVKLAVEAPPKEPEPVPAADPGTLVEAGPPLAATTPEELDRGNLEPEQAPARGPEAQVEAGQLPTLPGNIEEVPVKSVPVPSAEPEAFGEMGLPLGSAAAEETEQADCATDLEASGEAKLPAVEPVPAPATETKAFANTDLPSDSAALEEAERAIEIKPVPAINQEALGEAELPLEKATHEEIAEKEHAELESVLTSGPGVLGQAGTPFESAVLEKSDVLGRVDGISGQTLEGSIEKTKATCIEDTATEASGGELRALVPPSQYEEGGTERTPHSPDDAQLLQQPLTADPVSLEPHATDEDAALDEEVIASQQGSPAAEPVSPEELPMTATAEDEFALDERAVPVPSQDVAMEDATPSDLAGPTEEGPSPTIEVGKDATLDNLTSRPDEATSVPLDLPASAKEEPSIWEDAVPEKEAISAPCLDPPTAAPVTPEAPSPIVEAERDATLDKMVISVPLQDSSAQNSWAADLPKATEKEPLATFEKPGNAAPDEEVLSPLDRDFSIRDSTTPGLPETKTEEPVAVSAAPMPKHDPLREPDETKESHEQEQHILEAAAGVPKQDEELTPSRSDDTEVSKPKDQSTDGEWSSSTGTRGRKSRKKRRGQFEAEEKAAESSDHRAAGTEPPLEANDKPELAQPRLEPLEANNKPLAQPRLEPALPPLDEPASPIPKVVEENANDAMILAPAFVEAAVPSISQGLEAPAGEAIPKHVGLVEPPPDAAHDGPERGEVMPLAESSYASPVALESIPEAPEVAHATSQESSEDRSSTKKSKKNRKKAQRAALAAAGLLAASLAPDPSTGVKEETVVEHRLVEEMQSVEESQPAPEPELAEEQEPVDQMLQMQEPPPAKEAQTVKEPLEPEPTGSWADEVSEKVSVVLADTASKEATAGQEGGEAELAVPFQDHAAREESQTDAGIAEGSAEHVHIVESEQIPAPAAPESRHTATISEAVPHADAAVTEPPIPTPEAPETVEAEAPEAPTGVDAEHEWSPAIKNKWKKTKGKGSGAATPAAESGASSQPESADVPRPSIAVTGPEPAADPLPQAEELKPTEPQQTPHFVPDNDALAFTTKKSRKGRKRKNGSGVATPAMEPDVVAESVPVQAIGEIGEQTRGPEKATDALPERKRPNEESQQSSEVVEAPGNNPPATTTELSLGGEREEMANPPTVASQDPEAEGPPSLSNVLWSEAKDRPLPTEPRPSEETGPAPEAEHTEPPEVAVGAEHEWPTSKKKNRGKGVATVSTHGSIASTPEEPGQADISEALGSSEAQPEEPVGRDLGTSQTEESMVASAVEEHVVVDAMDVDAPQDLADAPKAAEKEPTDPDMISAPTEASSDRLWEAPAKEKAAKAKKRESKQPIAVISQPGSHSPGLPATSTPNKAEETSPTNDEVKGRLASDQEAASAPKPEAEANQDSASSPPRTPSRSQGSEAIEMTKAFIEQPISEPGQKQLEDNTASRDAPTDMGTASFSDVLECGDGPWAAGRREAQVADEKGSPIKEAMVKGETVEGSGPSNTERAAAAAAITGGVALIAEKFGGSRKTKKGKQKIVDRRQPREEDIFDEPALWEGADKKGLETRQEPGMDGDFWGGSEEKADASNARQAGPCALVSESLTESEGGWKETARQGAALNEDSTESPVLGRGESSLVMAEPAGLLRWGPEVAEPVGGLLEEEREAPAVQGSATAAATEPKRSPSRALPAVPEFPEAEAEATRYHWSTTDAKRDSGFGSGSPHPQQGRGKLLRDREQRDSGAHTGGGGEAVSRTPEPGVAAKPRRSPYGTPVVRGGTPVLREPAAAEATPEPEKKRVEKKSYGDLGGTAAALTPSRTERRAESRQTERSASDDGRAGSRQTERSASDGHAADSRGQPPASEQAGASFGARRSASNTSLARRHTPEPLKFRAESPGNSSIVSAAPPAPPLRRMSKRMSGDLRALRRQSSAASSTTTHDKELQASGSSSPSPPPPVANESRARARGGEMTDVFDGFGEGRMGSPRSPTRPHSMRRRQSMQVLELESRVEQLVAEKVQLADARSHAEQRLTQRAASVLSERDAEIESLKQSLHFLHNEVSRLTDVNDGLASANAELAAKDTGRHAHLELRHAALARELDEARAVGSTLTHALRDKDAEIAALRAQLDSAKEQMRDMQRKILDSRAATPGFLNLKDDDYFDNRCQQLCSHVQQWVLRFSKFSDMRACRLTSEINDEKTIDRLDNAVLDGSDVDSYLNDRVRRRDIFMSMTMNMIWEFVFTRYLFGMDREQRQKLKSLEKLLIEVGPAQAVRQWRAVTLTLLCKRANFRDQRELDTEAVVQAVFQTLSKILPPPGNLEGQIQSQLRRVMREAVDLSVEMRTQRAEYMMLPPLQPEYDADGELAATVHFDAAMMNERSGNLSMSNEDIEAQGAVVRIVLFPLVVKRGDDDGVGEDKVVVCPAQVLVARDKGKRHLTPSSDAGGASLGAPSRLSVVTDHSMAHSDGQYLAGHA